MIPKPLDLVGVVQAGERDRAAGDQHRLEDREGRERARLAHMHVDILHKRRRLVLLPLVGDEPARGLAGAAHAGPLGEVIHLEDDAVDLEVERVDFLGHFVGRLAGLFDPLAELHVGRAGNVPVADQFQEFAMRFLNSTPSTTPVP